VLGEFHMTRGAHLFGLPNVSQAGLEPAVVRAAVTEAAHLFSWSKVAWRSFVRARGSRVSKF
jgi:hypothetical protein